MKSYDIPTALHELQKAKRRVTRMRRDFLNSDFHAADMEFVWGKTNMIGDGTKLFTAISKLLMMFEALEHNLGTELCELTIKEITKS